MSMKERMKAAALMLKCKVLLLRDKNDTKARKKKWVDLRGKLEKKSDQAQTKKGHEEQKKVEAIQDVLPLIELVLKAVDEYGKEIEKLSKLVKEAKILDDTDKLVEFNKDVKYELDQMRIFYDRYKERKGKALIALKKTAVAWKKDWDDRLIAWVRKEKPTWESVKKLGWELVKDITIYDAQINK